MDGRGSRSGALWCPVVKGWGRVPDESAALSAQLVADARRPSPWQPWQWKSVAGGLNCCTTYHTPAPPRPYTLTSSTECLLSAGSLSLCQFDVKVEVSVDPGNIQTFRLVGSWKRSEVCLLSLHKPETKPKSPVPTPPTRKPASASV